MPWIPFGFPEGAPGKVRCLGWVLKQTNEQTTTMMQVGPSCATMSEAKLHITQHMHIMQKYVQYAKKYAKKSFTVHKICWIYKEYAKNVLICTKLPKIFKKICWIGGICIKYAKKCLICKKCAKNMLNMQRHAKICIKYAQNMQQHMWCKKYAKNMQKICQNMQKA